MSRSGARRCLTAGANHISQGHGGGYRRFSVPPGPGGVCAREVRPRTATLTAGAAAGPDPGVGPDGHLRRALAWGWPHGDGRLRLPQDLPDEAVVYTLAFLAARAILHPVGAVDMTCSRFRPVGLAVIGAFPGRTPLFLDYVEHRSAWLEEVRQLHPETSLGQRKDLFRAAVNRHKPVNMYGAWCFGLGQEPQHGSPLARKLRKMGGQLEELREWTAENWPRWDANEEPWTNFSNLVSTLTHDAWADTDVAAATLGDAGPRGGALGAGAGRAAD